MQNSAVQGALLTKPFASRTSNWYTSSLTGGADFSQANLGYAQKVSFIDSLMAMGANGATIDISNYVVQEDYASLKRLLRYKKTITEVRCTHLVSFTEPRMVQFLLDNGMKPDATCEEAGGGTLFLSACERGNGQVMKILLKAGANPNVTGSFGKTTLLMMAEDGDSAIATLMLRNHLDLYREPEDAALVKEYPLETAIAMDNLPMVAWLMQHGVKMHEPVTPEEYAKSHQAKKTEAWLTRHK